MNQTGFFKYMSKTVHILTALAGSLFLCSCATTRPPSIVQLPPEMPINESAGRGSFVVLTLQTTNGDAFPLLLDTGTSGTLFDKSVESKLGKSIGAVSVVGWGQRSPGRDYAMPQLYLGGVPLKVPAETAAYDLGPLADGSGTHFDGILGYDVLQHYCIQLDFAAGKIRFLDDKTADKKSWGKEFQIVDLNDNDSRPALAQNLLGEHGPHSLIDTGSDNDGWLMPKNYRKWTNGIAVPGLAHAPVGLFDGRRYPAVSLGVANVESDGIGIRFWARHMVTLDFPKRKLYLKLQTLSPLLDPNLKMTPVPKLR